MSPNVLPFAYVTRLVNKGAEHGGVFLYTSNGNVHSTLLYIIADPLIQRDIQEELGTDYSTNQLRMQTSNLSVTGPMLLTTGLPATPT